MWTLGTPFVQAEVERFNGLSRQQRQHGVLKALSDGARRLPSYRMRWGCRRRRYFEYRVAGVKACAKCFCHVNCITLGNLKTLQGRVSSNRLGHKLHYGNNRHPTTQWSARLAQARSFIESFIDNNCVPCPDATSKVTGQPEMILPLHFSPKIVFKTYTTACEGSGIGRTLFDKLKKGIFKGRVRLEKRKTAYCKKCATYVGRKRASRNTAEDDAAFATHRDFFKSARDMYNASVKEARRSAKEATQTGGVREVGMLSFDYAANFILPKVNIQVSEDFFKTMVGVNMFGVVDEATNRQKTFLFPEGKCPELDKAGSSSAQAVCSMVWHAILAMPKTRHLNLQADNCSAQNKNNFLLKMCMLLIEQGVVESIDLRFMAVGHTKFSPDRLFGSIKTAAKTKVISSFDELVSHVEENRFCEAVTTFDWLAFKSFLLDLIPGVIPGVKSFYRFEIRRGFKVTAYKGYPSTVSGAAESQSETPLRKTFGVKDECAASMRDGLARPRVIPPAGLSAERRRSLLEDVAPIYPGSFEDFVNQLVRECDDLCPPRDHSAFSAEVETEPTARHSLINSAAVVEETHRAAICDDETSTDAPPTSHAAVECQVSPQRKSAPSREPVWCGVCEKTLSCRRNYNAHIKSAAHKRKVL